MNTETPTKTIEEVLNELESKSQTYDPRNSPLGFEDGVLYAVDTIRRALAGEKE